MSEGATSLLTDAVAMKILNLPLPLDTDSPDPLGLSQVSGFYGPGAWAGWTITVCASWLGLWSGGADKGFDANTWAYLLVVEWAAIDLIRHVKRLYMLYSDESVAAGAVSGEQTWLGESSSVAAALTIVFWGAAHGGLQLLCCCVFPRCRSWQRGMTLALFLLLPAGGLALAVFYLHTWEARYEIRDNIPAFYWEGMSQETHDIGIFMASMAGLWYLVFWCSVILLVLFSSLPTSCWQACRSAYMVGYFVILILICFGRLNFLWAFAPVVFLVFVFAFPIYAAAMFSFASLGALTVYFGQGSAPPNSLQSCFYMPCSKNSISEMDQAGALFIGLVLFVTGEVVVPVYARFKRVYAERRDFELQVDQMGGRATAGVASRQGGHSDTGLNAARRVDSGIMVEEGHSPVPDGVARTGPHAAEPGRVHVD